MTRKWESNLFKYIKRGPEWRGDSHQRVDERNDCVYEDTLTVEADMWEETRGRWGGYSSLRDSKSVDGLEWRRLTAVSRGVGTPLQYLNSHERESHCYLRNFVTWLSICPPVEMENEVTQGPTIEGGLPTAHNLFKSSSALTCGRTQSTRTLKESQRKQLVGTLCRAPRSTSITNEIEREHQWLT